MLGFVPLRSINKVYKETVVFSEKDGKISGHLAFDNPRGILLRTRDGFVLEEGADYRVEKNEVILLNKSIPYFKKEWLKNENVPLSIPSENGEYDVGKCLIISPAYLRSVQILADYDCDKTPFPSALPYKINLEKSYKKLTEDKKLRIALYGDSVCNAANSSWEIGFEGYKHWMSAAAERSEKFYGAKIEVVNFSRSGYGIGWGLEAAEEKFGLEIGAASFFASVKGKFGLIKYATDGTSLFDRWNAFGDGGEDFQNLNDTISAGLLNYIKLGFEPRIKSFLWMQGENDAIYTEQAQSYERNLEEFIKKIRLLYGE